MCGHRSTNSGEGKPVRSARDKHNLGSETRGIPMMSEGNACCVVALGVRLEVLELDLCM